ncbi:MAG TPA: polysaccharide biosynthesis/export family protein, partial [Candidatus Caccomonas pullistercoris]|nr:polysaccharide biosynthesis/export family protein [Candidatus Caccomonas pullistercoris]
MKRKKQTGLACVLLALALSSCSSREKIVYVNDMVPGVGYAFDVHHEAVVHADDRLGITVACKNPELAIPFNIHGGSFRVGDAGQVEATGTSTKEQGYRVDADGYIDFPILGKLHVEGLRVSEVT